MNSSRSLTTEAVAESGVVGRVGLGVCGVAKSYRPMLRDQPMLLPIDMHEWLPPDHLAWFVLEVC
jgi:hypothetical protein